VPTATASSIRCTPVAPRDHLPGGGRGRHRAPVEAEEVRTLAAPVKWGDRAVRAARGPGAGIRRRTGDRHDRRSHDRRSHDRRSHDRRSHDRTRHRAGGRRLLVRPPLPVGVEGVALDPARIRGPPDRRPVAGDVARQPQLGKGGPARGVPPTAGRGVGTGPGLHRRRAGVRARGPAASLHGPGNASTSRASPRIGRPSRRPSPRPGCRRRWPTPPTARVSSSSSAAGPLRRSSTDHPGIRSPPLSVAGVAVSGAGRPPAAPGRGGR
jgi:hypothetical protein